MQITRNDESERESMENREPTAKGEHTRRVLATRFMEMLETQSFKKITVNDICQRAMVSRATFYFHFEDKYSLLRYCIEGELQRWEEVMESSDIDRYLVFVLNEILKKKKFYYNTLVVEPEQELTDMFHTLFSRVFATRIEALRAQGRAIPGPVSVVSAFYAGGIVCSTIQWIKNGFDISIEEMAECQKHLLAELTE
jgi:AcrR family transcriptional regulator